MENLTEENKDYIKSFRLWIKSQELNLEEVENEYHHSLKRLELERKQAELFKKRIDNNIAYKKSCVNAYEDWCNQNGIDPNIEL